MYTYNGLCSHLNLIRTGLTTFQYLKRTNGNLKYEEERYSNVESNAYFETKVEKQYGVDQTSLLSGEEDLETSLSPSRRVTAMETALDLVGVEIHEGLDEPPIRRPRPWDLKPWYMMSASTKKQNGVSPNETRRHTFAYQGTDRIDSSHLEIDYEVPYTPSMEVGVHVVPGHNDGDLNRISSAVPSGSMNNPMRHSA